MITGLDWIFIILTAMACLIQYWVTGKKAPEAKIVRFSRLLVVLLSLATLVSFYGNALERERNLSRVLSSIQRSLDQIRDISVSFQATIPADSPGVSAFRDRLVNKSEVCLASGGLGPHAIAPDCLPDLSKDLPAYLRLGGILLFLDFYRHTSGIDADSENEKADWSLGFSASLQEGTLSLDYDRMNDRIILRGPALKPFDFEAPGDVVSVADLESGEVEVVIRLRPAFSESGGVEESVQFEVVNMNVRGAHTWIRRITRAQTKRQVEPYPSYRYRIVRKSSGPAAQ